MTHIQGDDRAQSTLLPATLDDYVSPDNPVRVIEAFVLGLDMSALGFRHVLLERTGRPPYNPSDLLKLYIYGYLNRIRSSRLLEKATTRTMDLMWLMKNLQPDFKTISDFRKDNPAALEKVFREFTLLCKEMNLFSAELVAIDGSKFSASNHNSRTYTKKSLAKTLAEIDAKIRVYTKMLDTADTQDDAHERVTGLPETTDLRERIESLQATQARLALLQQQLTESGESQLSLTDPDSRKMMTGNKGTDCSYNVQMSVEGKHKLIIDIDPTSDCNDQQQLHRMATRAKEILQTDELSVVADTGYYKEQDIYDCAQENITCFVPEPAKSQNKELGLYTDKDFRYDHHADCYTCPAGKRLSYQYTFTKGNKPTRVYSTAACRSCSLRAQCTRSVGDGRRIYRWEHEALIEQMTSALHQQPDKVVLRKCLVEHPFGTIKHAMQCHNFLVRGREKVRAEACLFALCYNLKRILNIVGIERILRQLKTKIKNASMSLKLVRPTILLHARVLLSPPRWVFTQ